MIFKFNRHYLLPVAAILIGLLWLFLYRFVTLGVFASRSGGGVESSQAGRQERDGGHLNTTTRRILPPVVGPIPHAAEYSDSQVRQVFGSGAVSLFPERTIWFVEVQYARKLLGGFGGSAIIYFTPTLVHPRLRKGECTYMFFVPGLPAIEHAIAKTYEIPSNYLHPSGGKKFDVYYQVSSANTPFTPVLDVPEEEALPFTSTGNLPCGDVIAIVDLARSSPEQRVEFDGRYVRLQFDGTARILWLRRENALYEVHTGAIRGPRGGRGEYLRCVKDSQGFRVEKIGAWSS